jgi:hypothetical protein
MANIHTSRNPAPQPELFTVAFVRHPLTWYQSYFSYKQRKGWDPNNDWDDVVRCDSFLDFVEAAISKTPAYYSKMLRRFVGRACDEMEFIGRFESLTDDLVNALQLAGEEFDENVIRNTPPVNQTSYDRYPAVYSDGLAERVLEVEAEAVERFYSENANCSE